MGTELLTTNEAARLVKVSPRTLEKWRRTGEGPKYHVLGGVVRYSTEELQLWTASRVRECTPMGALIREERNRKIG